MSSEWKILYTKQVLKDKRIAYEAGFKTKIEDILRILKDNPFNNYPPYEKLIGDLSGAYARRKNLQHRIVIRFILRRNTLK